MIWRPTISRWWVGGEGLGIPSWVPFSPRVVFPCLPAFVADNSGSARPVLLVTKQLALFSFPVVRSKMRDIMAGMDEKDRECCCSATSPLYMTVTCPVLVWPEVYRFMDFSGR